MHHYTSVAEQFIPQGRVLDVHEFGNGNINDTYLVTTDSNDEPHFVLQRINTQVFKHPKPIMQNMRIFTEHMRRRAREEGHPWEMPRVLKTCEGQDFFLDGENSFWRAISYVEGARSFDTIHSSDHAREVGHALGTFQHLISDLPVETLADTLEGFHITPLYLEQYDQTISHNGFVPNAEVRLGLDFVAARRQWARELSVNDPELFRHLVPCDPVVTVAPDVVFFEAFANIYLEAFRAIEAELAGKPLPKDLDYPTADDGVYGMAFIETVVKRSKLGAKWLKFPKV